MKPYFFYKKIKAPKALKWQILSEIHQKKKILICIKPLQEGVYQKG